MSMKFSECDFKGIAGLQILSGLMRAVIITDRGPRIAFFGRPGGENLLFWEPGKHFRNEWELMGGHRIWVTRPLADECEETYFIDKKRCDVERVDGGWIVYSAEDTASRTKRGIAIRAMGENVLEVDGFLINTGDMLFSCGVWALTCTLASDATRYAIPLGDGNIWDYTSVVMFRKWDGHTGGYVDDQFAYTEEMMLVAAKGRENKRMVHAPKGIFAMRDEKRDLLFAKKAPYIRGGLYPNGCNLAVYTSPGSLMVEMESMGAQLTLKPGESIHHKETWIIDSAGESFDSKSLESRFG